MARYEVRTYLQLQKTGPRAACCTAPPDPCSIHGFLDPPNQNEHASEVFLDHHPLHRDVLRPRSRSDPWSHLSLQQQMGAKPSKKRNHARISRGQHSSFLPVSKIQGIDCLLLVYSVSDLRIRGLVNLGYRAIDDRSGCDRVHPACRCQVNYGRYSVLLEVLHLYILPYVPT
jgi:hypothetical protein